MALIIETHAERVIRQCVERLDQLIVIIWPYATSGLIINQISNVCELVELFFFSFRLPFWWPCPVAAALQVCIHASNNQK